MLQCTLPHCAPTAYPASPPFPSLIHSNPVSSKLEALNTQSIDLTSQGWYRSKVRCLLILDSGATAPFTQLLKGYFPRIVGSCIYLSITCRPDISTITSKACKGMHGPKKVHILYLQMLIRYLKGHRDLALTYTKQGSGASLLFTLSET